MNCDGKADSGRRRLLVATATAGGVAGVAAALPWISSFAPPERARSAGTPVEVDISKLDPGQMMTVEWRGKPVWIIHRTKEMLDSLGRLDERVSDPQSRRSTQPEYARNTHRSIRPEYLVAVGICTHLGCLPAEKFKPGIDSGISAEWPGGFLCPCHGSKFDIAGRVYRNMPAQDNLEIPPHAYLSPTKILVGEDRKGG